jgi:hypothetical protein
VIAIGAGVACGKELPVAKSFRWKEKDMRIICDYCSRPISGTVKRMVGNFNIHPECLAQLVKQVNHEPTASSWRRQDRSLRDFVGYGNTIRREMK